MKKLELGILIITIILIICGCHTKGIPNHETTEKFTLSESEVKLFWEWISQRENDILNFDVNKNEQLLDEITKKITTINSDLTFTIGPVNEGRRDFIISADRIRTAFPYVKKLVEGVNGINKLNVIAFRPRTELKEVQYANITLKYEQVFFKWKKEKSGKIDVDTYVKGFQKMNSEIEAVIFLLMDNSIGEYDVETKIGGISFNLYPPDGKEELLPFDKLRTIIDENY